MSEGDARAPMIAAQQFHIAPDAREYIGIKITKTGSVMKNRIAQPVGRVLAALALMVGAGTLAGCGGAGSGDAHDDQEHADTHGEVELERGPHGGRLLREGAFAIELTIFETGTPPRFRLYAYRDGAPLAPQGVNASVTLSRLGGRVDTFEFAPEGDFLTSPAIVEEPHSFDVVVEASAAGASHRWAYASYEGRTIISDSAAAEAGVVTEEAGPAIIAETIDVLGRVEFAPGAQAVLRGRFPGVVVDVRKTVGDPVSKGETIARLESNESLMRYDVQSPIDGVLIERSANPGDVAADAPLFMVGDLKKLVVDFHVFASDIHRVKPGMKVAIVNVDRTAKVESVIQTILPTKETATQTIIARALLPNDGAFTPGMTVRGDIVVEEFAAPLAVRADALQRFRDFTVVFEKIGETYEVRMLDLGRRNGDWAEVTGGLEEGAVYVAENSFLIKADIEKSGASHDH